MAKARAINLRAFLASLHPDTLLAFLEREGLPEAGKAWLHFNPDALLAYADHEDNVERVDPIIEQIEKISEICLGGPGLVVRAYRRYGIPLNADLSPGELAMQLYLLHRHAYDFAHSKYLLYGGGAVLSVFKLQAEYVDTGTNAIDAFRQAVALHYSSLDHGSNCDVQPFTDGPELVLMVQRGHYVETRPIWEQTEIVVQTSRPAIEDVLTWDSESRELRIRTSQPRDRDKYLWLFAEHLCGDEQLAEDAKRNATFSLEPLATGTFNFRGSGRITRVELKELRMKLRGVSQGVLTLRASEVRDMFQYDLQGLGLGSGLLLSAKFKVLIHRPGQKRPQEMTFSITPPDQTDIGERRNALIVLEFLEEQGIKLR